MDNTQVEMNFEDMASFSLQIILLCLINPHTIFHTA